MPNFFNTISPPVFPITPEPIVPLPPQDQGEAWKSWAGKAQRPVDDMVQIKMRNGRIMRTQSGDIRWLHIGSDSDVVAYRPAKEFSHWVFTGQKSFSELRSFLRKIKAEPDNHDLLQEYAAYCGTMYSAWHNANTPIRKDAHTIDVLEKLTGDSYYYCAHHSGEILHETAVYHEDMGNSYCESAYDRVFSNCDCCGDATHRERLTAVTDEEGDGITICRGCYEDNSYRSCRNCGSHRMESCGQTGCGLSGSGALLHNHSADVTRELKSFLKTDAEPKTKLFFGIELEVLPRQGVHQRTALEMCKEAMGATAICKNDGSLNGGGFEIVTVPATLKYHREQLWNKFFANEESNEIYDATTKKGCVARAMKSWATGCCGMHIHFSTNACSPMQLSKIFCFIHDTANADFLSKIAGRPIGRDSRWCKTGKRELKAVIPQEKRGKPINTIVKNVRRSGELNHHVKALQFVSDNHYQAISYSEHTGGKTCEMRIFRGNITKHGVMRALDFVAAMIQFCAETGGTSYMRSIGPRGGRDIVRGLSYQAFLAWFDTPQHRGAYPDLWRQLINLKYLETKHTFKVRVADGLLKGTFQDVNMVGEILDVGDSHVDDPSLPGKNVAVAVAAVSLQSLSMQDIQRQREMMRQQFYARPPLSGRF